MKIPHHPSRNLRGAALLFLLAAITATTLAVDVASTPASGAAEYVGQQTCLQSGCHEGASGGGGIYAGAEAFYASFHQRGHLVPSPESVIIERYFAADSLLVSPQILGGIRDTLSLHLSKGSSGADYFVQMRLASGDTTPRLRIAYTFGGNGWMQRFLVKLDGHYYTLPFQYILPAYGDRSDTGTTFTFSDLEDWAYADTSAGRIRFLQFTSLRFHQGSWDRNCAPCHANLSGMDVASSVNDTLWTPLLAGGGDDSLRRAVNMSIGCESCHGPGSEHAADPAANKILSPSELGNTKQGIDLKLDLCNQCHSRMKSSGGTYAFAFDESNHRKYLPGTPLNEYIREGDIWQGASIWPDSSELEHHQHGQDFARSYGYQKHVYKDGCWSCHTVHSSKNGLPFQLNRNWYSMRDGEGCLSCHGSMGALLQTPLEDFTKTDVVNGRRVNVHTRHSPEVSQCVNCHFSKTASFTKTQLPGKPYYDFTSHHFKVIRPLLTREFRNDPNGIGQINTCAEACHRNGRGSRNFHENDPVAPDFGITDKILTEWNEASDIELADSLWQHYQAMFLPSLSADREAGPATSSTGLATPYPNPARDHATIRFTVAAASRLSLEIHSLDGRLVRVLASGLHQPGGYVAAWDTADELGMPVASGIYVARLAVGERVYAEKIRVQR